MMLLISQTLAVFTAAALIDDAPLQAGKRPVIFRANAIDLDLGWGRWVHDRVILLEALRVTSRVVIH
jgi:hypothetical protein